MSLVGMNISTAIMENKTLEEEKLLKHNLDLE